MESTSTYKILFKDNIIYAEGWICTCQTLFNYCYDYFYSLEIILLILNNFKDKIINFVHNLVITCLLGEKKTRIKNNMLTGTKVVKKNIQINCTHFKSFNFAHSTLGYNVNI